MSDTTPIQRDELDAAARRFCRQIASVIIAMMSETDTSFTMIAAKLGKREKEIRRFVHDLADGAEGKHGIRMVAEIAWAMDCVVTLSANKRA